jgi:hypothetical protein
MVLRNYARGAFQKLNATKNLLTVHRMFSHQHPLVFGQLRGFAQNQIRHAYLSDVMQQRTEFQRLHPRRIETVFPSQTQTVGDHPFGVTMRFLVPRLQSSGQCFQGRAISIFEGI